MKSKTYFLGAMQTESELHLLVLVLFQFKQIYGYMIKYPLVKTLNKPMGENQH